MVCPLSVYICMHAYTALQWCHMSILVSQNTDNSGVCSVFLASITENTKARINDHLWGNPIEWCSTQRASNAETVISRYHHAWEWWNYYIPCIRMFWLWILEENWLNILCLTLSNQQCSCFWHGAIDAKAFVGTMMIFAYSLVPVQPWAP